MSGHSACCRMLFKWHWVHELTLPKVVTVSGNAVFQQPNACTMWELHRRFPGSLEQLRVHIPQHTHGRQRTTHRTLFSLPTVWVSGIKLTSSDLVINIFICLSSHSLGLQFVDVAPTLYSLCYAFYKLTNLDNQCVTCWSKMSLESYSSRSDYSIIIAQPCSLWILLHCTPMLVEIREPANFFLKICMCIYVCMYA